MAEHLERDPVFGALTRPQMFAGVTYTYFVVNAVVTIQAFLIVKSWTILPIPLLVHGFGYMKCLQEPLWFDIWLVKVRNNPRVKNYRFWRCNSYRP